MEIRELTNGQLRSRLAEAERKQQESDHKFRSLFNNSVAGVVIADVSGRLLEANEALCDLTGYSRKELERINVGQFYASPGKREEFLEALLRDGSVKDFQLELINRGGRHFWASFSSATIKWQGKNAIATTVFDITERKLAEEFLKSSEQKYRTLVEMSPYCIHQIDIEGRIMSMNRAGLEMLGAEDESSVIGLPYLEVVYHEDRERVSKLLQKAFKGSTWEFEFRSADGSDFRSTIVPKFDGEGKVDRLLGITQDITDHKRDQLKLAASEARYRSLMEDANDAILLIDAETGMLVDTNQEAQEMLNRSRKEILSMHFSELYPPEELGRDDDLSLLQLIRGGGVLGELTVLDREGRPIAVEVSSSVIQIEDSRVVQCIYRNLTERKRIEKELQQKKAEVAKVSRLSALGELTSGIAHELNQPLTAIANYVEAITDVVELESRDDHDLLQILSNLRDTAFRTSTIIGRLRGLIQKAAPHRSPTNVNDLVEDLIEFRKPQLERSNIQIQLELAEDLPMLVLDSIQIQQVLLNLLKNAQEAMRNMAADCRVLTIRTQHAEENVELSISDSGRGLPTEDYERLFDYFYTTTPGGLGVGLQVCRTIMEAHQGNIVACNNPTGGATFRLSFPLNTREASYAC